MRDIRRSSTDLKTIIDAIIDLTAIDAGALELKLEHVEVTALLETVAEKLAYKNGEAIFGNMMER